MGQKTLANGTSEHYAYDTRSRLTQVQLKQGATVLRTTGYAWDNADQITSQTVNGVTTNYGYDLAGQLTSEVRSGYNVAYTYDANGNRLSKTVNGVAESYTYDLADKMLTAGAKSYTYDAAGRTVGINAPGGTTTLTYDYESRVTAITGPGINETHTYNGLDTRVGTVQGGVSRTFVRDGSYVTDPVLRDGQATYTPGVSERRGGVSTWSHSGLKNADAQTTSVGAIAATRVYDAFGAELSATGTWKGPFGYAGGFGYQEDSSGLKLLGHRYYDPTTGRFLSRDPIKDGRNWYVYCVNSPVDSYDITGLAPNKKIEGTDISYRIDASQKPYPNMHVYKNGKEVAVIDPIKGELPSHNGKQLEPLPKSTRKQIRKYTNKFQKKFAKAILGRVPIVGALLAIVAVAEGQPVNEAAMDATPIVGDIKFVGEEFILPALDEYVDENRSGGFGSSSGINSQWDPHDEANW